ncbi:MAG: hypothetical protein QM657_18510 [Lacrimispora sp.]|uniref:glycine-rich domain-containing protein n=1 Tax=Lacrimispora sp. TaxID=2719234 RepID=UPI0039E4DF7C
MAECIVLKGGGDGVDLEMVTVEPGDVLAGEVFIDKEGEPKTGTMVVQSILSFSAAVYSSTAISFTWKNPEKGPFSGVIIIGKTGSYPTSISDGTRYYKGSGNNMVASGSSSATVTSFTGGTSYYFRAFSYAIKDDAEWIHATSYTATVETTKGQQAFASSGTFTVPAGVRSVDIFCVGAGAGGGYGETIPSWAGNNASRWGGNGGAGGFTKTTKGISVNPGDILNITVGAGGNTSYSQFSGLPGGATSVTKSSTTLISANGGQSTGGGSGGGTGSTFYLDRNDQPQTQNAKVGGQDGASTSTSAGQGFTTRAFGEPTGTLYGAGGGGGGIWYGNPNVFLGGASGGAVGGGAGGTSGSGGTAGSNGTNGTGAGGGGGAGSSIAGRPGGSGGSGVVIFRWGY